MRGLFFCVQVKFFFEQFWEFFPACFSIHFVSPGKNRGLDAARSDAFKL
jgi:hypothetical protein